MGDFLDIYVGQIEDEKIKALLADLEFACGVRTADFAKMSLWSFLVQCIYPNGARGERREIDLSYLAHESILEARLSDLATSSVFSLCECVLRRRGYSTEFFHEETVVEILNHALPTFGSLGTEKEEIDDALRQRRLNRSK